MKTQVILSEQAAKELKRLDLSFSKHIVESIMQLIKAPDKNVMKLAGIPYYRLRAWDFYAIFDIQKNMLRILALKIRRRRRANKKNASRKGFDRIEHIAL